MKSYGKSALSAASLSIAISYIWLSTGAYAQVGNPYGVNPNKQTPTANIKVPKNVPNARYIPVVQQVAPAGYPAPAPSDSTGVERTTGRPKQPGAPGEEEESETPSFQKPDNQGTQLGRYR